MTTVNQKALTLGSVDWSKFDAADQVKSHIGVVTSDDARCSAVGVEILKLGGHAVDAAIATALCLGVVNPTESGIGGGAFMIVRSAFTSETHAFDMRETAPAASSTDMYKGKPKSQIEGALSIGVPGELKGLHKAWKMYGRLPWRTLFEPAIYFAKNGFQVSQFLANDIKHFESNIKNDPGLKQVFAPNGEILKVNETCYNKKLAETLGDIAKHGPQAFYKGLVCQRLINDVKNAGGILTMKDLNNYKVKMRDVLESNVLGYKILGMPPPSSGTVGLTMVANVLDNYGSSSALEGSLGLHRLTEAMKHMLGMKMNLGDPDYDNVSECVASMTSPVFAKKIWNKIDDNKTFSADNYYDNRNKQVQDNGTGHLGVIDAERNAVALTTSLNDEFGSKMLSPSTGIVLNNQMRDFSTPTEELKYLIRQLMNYLSHFPFGGQLDEDLPPPIANLIEPAKRLLSSTITPIIRKLADVLKDYESSEAVEGSLESSEAVEGSSDLDSHIEAIMKHMLGMKMNLGDPDYDDVSKYVSSRTSLDFGTDIWDKVHDNENISAGNYYDSRFRQIQDNGIGHLGIADVQRIVVALTTSVNNQFGANVSSPSAGIVVNDQTGEFSTPIEELINLIRQFINYISHLLFEEKSDLPLVTSNLIEPGKRPLSSMTPLVILKDGHLAGVIGGSGGPNIIAAVTQVFLDHYIHGKDPRVASHKARIYPKLQKKELDYGHLKTISKEHIELSEDHREFLKKRGHDMTKVKLAASCHLIVQDLKNPNDLKKNLGHQNPQWFGMLTGVGDPRKNAKPAAM